MGLSWYWKKSKHIPFYYFVLSYTIIYNTCRNGKILLAGNRYVIVAEHILLAFILCSMANPRLCCWLLHAPFMVRNITECLNASPLTSVRINSTVELMALIFLALIFSSSLKAAKLTNRLQTNAMRLPSPCWFSCNSGEKVHQTFKGASQDLQ